MCNFSEHYRRNSNKKKPDKRRSSVQQPPYLVSHPGKRYFTKTFSAQTSNWPHRHWYCGTRARLYILYIIWYNKQVTSSPSILSGTRPRSEPSRRTRYWLRWSMLASTCRKIKTWPYQLRFQTPQSWSDVMMKYDKRKIKSPWFWWTWCQPHPIWMPRQERGKHEAWKLSQPVRKKIWSQIPPHTYKGHHIKVLHDNEKRIITSPACRPPATSPAPASPVFLFFFGLNIISVR